MVITSRSSNRSSVSLDTALCKRASPLAQAGYVERQRASKVSPA